MLNNLFFLYHNVYSSIRISKRKLALFLIFSPISFLILIKLTKNVNHLTSKLPSPQTYRPFPCLSPALKIPAIWKFHRPFAARHSLTEHAFEDSSFKIQFAKAFSDSTAEGALVASSGPALLCQKEGLSQQSQRTCTLWRWSSPCPKEGLLRTHRRKCTRAAADVQVRLPSRSQTLRSALRTENINNRCLQAGSDGTHQSTWCCLNSNGHRFLNATRFWIRHCRYCRH